MEQTKIYSSKHLDTFCISASVKLKQTVFWHTMCNLEEAQQIRQMRMDRLHVYDMPSSLKTINKTMQGKIHKIFVLTVHMYDINTFDNVGLPCPEKNLGPEAKPIRLQL